MTFVKSKDKCHNYSFKGAHVLCLCGLQSWVGLSMGRGNLFPLVWGYVVCCLASEVDADVVALLVLSIPYSIVAT